MANKVTTTFWKIKAMTTKIKVVQGGQAAGKNWAIAQILIEKALEHQRLITIMSDTYDNLKDGAIQDFKAIYALAGWDWDNGYNKTEKDLKLGNSVIQFRYISDIKPSAGKSKRRDILYMNEGNKIGWSIASTYIGRTHEDVYIDHNPDYEYWAHTEIPKLLNPDTGERMDSMIIVTYKDNELCPADERNYILARKGNTAWFNVYGLGQTGTYSDRRIFSFEWADSIPDTALRINSAMDFGQSPDPTILLDLFVDGPNLYVDERFCENNLLPEKLEGAERMSVVDKLNEIEFTKGWLIIGDTDGKNTIYDMIKHGYTAVAVKKLKGMRREGISKIRGYNLFLTRRSVNVKKGIENWFWKQDLNGKIVPEPERPTPDKHEPDGLAALRYGIMTHINQTAA